VTPVEETAVTVLKRQYPHVEAIGDWPAQQSVRLLWDRVFSLEERLQAAQTTIASLVGAANDNETSVVAAQQAADDALALSQRPGEESGSDVPTPGGGLPGGGDGGGGQTGCAAGLPSGHDSGGLLTAIRAGQLVCGTGNEWAVLRNPTPDLPTRESNAEELLRRMIWHLQQGGFTAGRQRNPSNLISKDKLTVVVDGFTRVYDVFTSYDTFTIQMQTQMFEIGGANMVSDAGIAD
jgi:hypothetical protein